MEGVVDPEKKVLNPVNIANEAYEFWQKGKGVDINLQEPEQ